MSNEPSGSEACQNARAVAKASAKGPSGSEAAGGGEESGKLRKRVPVGPKATSGRGGSLETCPGRQQSRVRLKA